NPRCSKSRATLERIRARGIEPRIVEYLASPPDAATLRQLLALLGLRASELARRGEAAWQDAGLGPDSDDDTVIAAMLAHPILIERPIVVAGDRAVLGRPPENVDALLDG
ncbi:MAG: arsenate reductase (glutaredoxin), partial [Gammaproteobacteria bacterium]|nr:arsenate reductase (glutaredoxin) [Gammaproteobacteria bacterium]